MKTILLVTLSPLSSLSPSARAGQLADLASHVAGEVSAKERFLNPEQRSQVTRQLNQILASLNNGGSNPGNRQYVCTSRDNDGNRPYVKMGYRFSGEFETGNEPYNSLADCARAL